MHSTIQLLKFTLKWLFFSALIGIIAGTSSAFFLISLDWITELRESHTYLIYFLPLAGLFIGFIYHRYGQSVFLGNNLLIDTMHETENHVPLRMAPMILFSTLITHLFGGSAGREGTALQMAGSLTDQFAKVFKINKTDRQIFLYAAISGGFGAVFGTPLAGAIFALEFFVIGKLNYKALLPVFFTGIVADLVCKNLGVIHTQYTIVEFPEMNLVNFILSIFSGLIFGLVAYRYTVIFDFIKSNTDRIIKNPIWRPFFGGFVIVAFFFISGNTRYLGLGIPVIEESFQHQLPIYEFAIKLLLTAFTLAVGFKGGEVTPLFFIGACLGNAISLFFPLPVSLLSGMGFVAVFGAAANTPIACIVMGIELFGAQSGVYIAISCIIAYLVSGNTGIYKNQKLGVSKS